ncbi:MAG: alpha/beta fold hydrolase [Gammaproteobacteria bacterium]|nr:alpha/beta fold hydrolase [Gammaproteobacteria bacterium]
MPKSRNGTAYQLSGPKNAPVVTLIHGIGINRHIWREYEPALSWSYRVLSYDLCGHGESVPPPARLSLTVFAKQLRELLDELYIERSALVGFSMGGMINRRFAMDYSERTSALVILNSPHERSPDAQKLVEGRATQTADGGPAATLLSSLERWFTPEFLATETDAVNEVRQWILSNDPQIYTQSRQVLAAGVIELIRPQPPISKPTLVITCEHDSGSTPAMAHGIAAEIKDAQTVIVPHLQHLGMMEQPSLFIEPIVNFLCEKLT